MAHGDALGGGGHIPWLRRDQVRQPRRRARILPHYPLPAPGLFVYLVGALEIGGGLLLAAGLLTRLAALALAADMIGAVVVSGLTRGEFISLTLAPLLLVAMIILIRFGAGAWSLDSWLAARDPLGERV